MATYTVTDDLISSERAAHYLDSADRRIRIGFRLALELLGVPVPESAIRKPTGRPPSRVIAAAYDADNPSYRPLTYQPGRSPKPGALIVAERMAQRP